MPLINGQAYSWASIRFELLGVPVVGIVGIGYGETERKENLYGVGRFATHRGYGEVEPNARISMYKDTLESMAKISPTGRIQDIPPFDITVAYITRTGKITKDIIKNFEFTEKRVETQQGDMRVIVDSECICSHIEWNK